MGVIQVNGIRLQAFHGCLDEEALIGGNYRVDIQVEGDFGDAESTDELKTTVDYGQVAAIVRAEMAIRSKLIEHVGSRILAALKAEWPLAKQWCVRVVKERPPIHGDVHDESIYYLLMQRLFRNSTTGDQLICFCIFAAHSGRLPWLGTACKSATAVRTARDSPPKCSGTIRGILILELFDISLPMNRSLIHLIRPH